MELWENRSKGLHVEWWLSPMTNINIHRDSLMLLLLLLSLLQFSHSVVSDSLQPHESQYTRPPCPSQLPEFTQTHVHQVSDATLPSNPWLSPSPWPPIPVSMRIFSNESTLPMGWPKYCSFSFSIIPSKEIPGLSPWEWTGWISLQSKGLSRVFSNTTVQMHQFFGSQPSSQSNSHIHIWLLEKP